MNKIFTPKFRVAFPQVFEPKSINGSKPKYGVTMIFDPAEIAKDPEEQQKWDALKAAVNETAIVKWGKAPAVLKKPFKKGDDQRNKENGTIYDGYEGMITLNAMSETKPGLVDENVQPVIEQNVFYGGCYARASVNMYAWDHPQSGKGVSCGLQNLQKIADGDPFSGRTKAEDDFGAIAQPTVAASNDELFD